MITPDRDQFRRLARDYNVVAVSRRLMSDTLTPVLGYRRLVQPDQRTAPSFLLESVENGDTAGRYSFIGAQPTLEVLAREHDVTVIDHRTGEHAQTTEDDPLAVLQGITAAWRVPPAPGLPFHGGWVGYAGYDTVRYLEPGKLPFTAAPPDDRGLPDLHFGLYRQVAVFDHVGKVLIAFNQVVIDEHADADAAYDAGCRELDEYLQRLRSSSQPIDADEVTLDPSANPGQLEGSFTKPAFQDAVRRCQDYIAAGDAFQIVLSQRMSRDTRADPFDIYRALRIVNPSPYMIYLQAQGSILVASSPEILCRAEGDTVVNRPLAGTRPRGRDETEDTHFQTELLASEKERAEHVMLVDLGRNDLGRVCTVGTIELPHLMEIERYSHVMHLSSTITGRLQPGLGCWDALRATLPVGTVSGAPKVRAMQIIDELEPVRRGPYAGGIGAVGLDGNMDIALALRTMVIPTADRQGDTWSVHLQAGAGVVADSDPAAEYQETVNKLAALARAIELAEGTLMDAEGRGGP